MSYHSDSSAWGSEVKLIVENRGTSKTTEPNADIEWDLNRLGVKEFSTGIYDRKTNPAAVTARRAIKPSPIIKETLHLLCFQLHSRKN